MHGADVLVKRSRARVRRIAAGAALQPLLQMNGSDVHERADFGRQNDDGNVVESVHHICNSERPGLFTVRHALHSSKARKKRSCCSLLYFAFVPVNSNV